MSPLRSIYRSVRSGAAPTAKSLLFKSGALRVLRRVRPSGQVAILRYHAICGPEGHTYASPSICISPSAFEQHVRYLSANYNVLSLPEAVTLLQENRPMPQNTVVITFDDGYADNLPAAQVMAKHGVTGTFYITAGCMAGGEPFWPAELRHLIRHLPAGRLILQAGAADVTLSISDAASRNAAVGTLTRLFKAHPIPVRDALRTQLREAAKAPLMPRVMLTWAELAEMAALGMTIGGHTTTHPNLPSAGLADATAEITSCRVRLEQELGVPVTMFSYPNGGAERYYTPDLQRVVREAGFLSAATSRNGFAAPGADVYALRRVQVAESVEDMAFTLEVERFAFRPGQ